MFKIVATIEAEGEKKIIYQLKEELLQKAAQHSCQVNLTLSNNQGFQESISASFIPIVDVNTDDIIDLSLCGDEMFELLEHKEQEKKE